MVISDQLDSLLVLKFDAKAVTVSDSLVSLAANLASGNERSVDRSAEERVKLDDHFEREYNARRRSLKQILSRQSSG